MFRNIGSNRRFEDGTYTASQISQAFEGTGYETDFKRRKCVIKNGREVVGILDRVSRHDDLDPEYRMVFGKDDIRVMSPLYRTREEGNEEIVFPNHTEAELRSERIRKKPKFYIRNVDNLLEEIEPVYESDSRRLLKSDKMQATESEYTLVFNRKNTAWSVRSTEKDNRGKLVADVAPRGTENAIVTIFDEKLASDLINKIRSKYLISESSGISERTISKDLFEKFKAVSSFSL